MHRAGDRTRRARRLRSDMACAEAVLWEMLRGRRLDGLKFLPRNRGRRRRTQPDWSGQSPRRPLHQYAAEL